MKLMSSNMVQNPPLFNKKYSPQLSGSLVIVYYKNFAGAVGFGDLTTKIRAFD